MDKVKQLARRQRLDDEGVVVVSATVLEDGGHLARAGLAAEDVAKVVPNGVAGAVAGGADDQAEAIRQAIGCRSGTGRCKSAEQPKGRELQMRAVGKQVRSLPFRATCRGT